MEKLLIDKEYIATELQKLILDSLSGAETKKKNIDVSLELPVNIINILQHIAEQTGVSLADSASQIAKEGISKQLTDMVGFMKNPQPKLEMPSQMNDFTKKIKELSQAMGSFSKIAEQMQQMEQSIEETETPEKNE